MNRWYRFAGVALPSLYIGWSTALATPASVAVECMVTEPFDHLDQPFRFTAQITPTGGASNISATLFYRVGTNQLFSGVSLLPSGDRYIMESDIPSLPSGAFVEYYTLADFDGPDASSPTVTPVGGAANPARLDITRIPGGTVWLNEVNYNPDLFNTDETNEFIEIAGLAGSDLSDWKIELGDTFSTYAAYSIPPATALSAEENGFGFFVLGDEGIAHIDMPLTNLISGTQHLAKRGAIRLIDEFGQVVSEYSYGTPPPTNDFPCGSYIGHDDDFVFEDEALALVGAGSNLFNFTWATNIILTPGAGNDGQALQGGTLNPPPAIACPPDSALNCIDELPAPDTNDVTATGTCGDFSVTINFVDDVTTGGSGRSGDPLFIIRTYRATSDCGATAECQQTFTVEDIVPPVIVDISGNELNNGGFEAGTLEAWSVQGNGPIEVTAASLGPSADTYHARFGTEATGSSLPNTSNLQLWLDASDPATLITTGSESSTLVSTWMDKSGNENHVTQTGLNRRPKLLLAQINGLPALDFDGVNDELTRNDALGFSGAAAITVFSVAIADTTDVRFFQLGAVAGTGGKVIGLQSDASFRFNNGNTVFGSYPMTTASDYSVRAWRLGAGTSYRWAELWVNGFRAYPSAISNQNGIIDLLDETTLVGAGNLISENNTSFDGRIAELIVYNKELTDEERQSVESYLLTKYGLDVGSIVFTGTRELIQDTPASAGQAWVAKTQVRQDSNSPLTGSGSEAGMQMIFLDDTDSVLATYGGATLTPESSTGTYQEHSIIATTPITTSKVRMRLYVTLDSSQPMIVDFDEAELSSNILDTGLGSTCGVEAPDLAGKVIATDNCGSVVITQNPAAGEELLPDNPVIEVIATDFGGLGLSTTGIVEFILQDLTPPALTCPDNLVVANITLVPPVDISTVIVAEPCGTPTVIHIGDSNNGGSGMANDPLIISRTYRASDPTGNSRDCTQIITVVEGGSSPPDVAVIQFQIDTTGVAIQSLGTNSWAFIPEYTTNLTLGEPGWIAVPATTNSYDGGINATVFGHPNPSAPTVHYRIRQSQ